MCNVCRTGAENQREAVVGDQCRVRLRNAWNLLQKDMYSVII
jgi:hypothetical protein